MRRRDVIALVASTAAWPLAAHAQQQERIRRVGILIHFDESDEHQNWVTAFRQRLEALDWSEGRNLRIDQRFPTGDLDRLRGYAAELVGLKPDVIFGDGTPVIEELQRATRTIPIVFVGASDPIGRGFVESLARPAGNITGFVTFEPSMGGKWLETLKEIAPRIARAGLIYNPQPYRGQYFPSMETAARALAVKLVPIPIRNAADLERGIDDFAREPDGGLVVLPDPSIVHYRDLTIALAARHRLPAIYPFRLFVTGGGLLAYGADRADLYRKAADHVVRILRGANPGDLPVQAPTKFELVINLETAKALALTVPRSLLVRADGVIR